MKPITNDLIVYLKGLKFKQQPLNKFTWCATDDETLITVMKNYITIEKKHNHEESYKLPEETYNYLVNYFKDQTTHEKQGNYFYLVMNMYLPDLQLNVMYKTYDLDDAHRYLYEQFKSDEDSNTRTAKMYMSRYKYFDKETNTLLGFMCIKTTIL